MSRYAGADLVSMAAILTGGAVSLIVTLGNLWLIDRDVFAERCASHDSPVEVEVCFGVYDPTAGQASTSFSSPEYDASADRVPVVDVEWEAASTYETIRSMAREHHGLYEVDLALEDLHGFAIAHAYNPDVQELYLKALRVTEYHAAANGDDVRAAILDARFWAHARDHLDHSGVVHESMRLLVQQLRRDCTDAQAKVAELRDLQARFPYDGPLGSTLMAGLDVAWVQGCGTSG